MTAFKHAALRVDDFRTHLALLEYVKLNDPKRYELDDLAVFHRHLLAEDAQREPA